ncbi:hypothetical protein [Hymenobacter agri]
MAVATTAVGTTGAAVATEAVVAVATTDATNSTVPFGRQGLST